MLHGSNIAKKSDELVKMEAFRRIRVAYEVLILRFKLSDADDNVHALIRWARRPTSWGRCRRRNQEEGRA